MAARPDRFGSDRELVQLARGAETNIPDPIAPWAAAQLRPDQVELLDALPLTATLDVDGLGTVLFCHATPREDEEVVLVDSRLERWLRSKRRWRWHRSNACSETASSG